MRYPEGHNEAVRARIVEAASHALRREGIDAVSIPELMKQAGLTHGGFYVHFRDRDELVAEAVAFAGEATAARVFTDDEPHPFRGYLSREHVKHPEHGCVLATLGFEARRQSPSVRGAFARVARGFLERVERRLHPNRNRGAISDDALAAASRMIGAIVLARLVQDDALVDRILAAARRELP